MNEELKEGIVEFRTLYKGSKSEGEYPVLVTGRNVVAQRLYFEDDNPFENESFREYAGVRVQVRGTIVNNGVFKVTDIEEI